MIPFAILPVSPSGNLLPGMCACTVDFKSNLGFFDVGLTWLLPIQLLTVARQARRCHFKMQRIHPVGVEFGVEFSPQHQKPIVVSSHRGLQFSNWHIHTHAPACNICFSFRRLHNPCNSVAWFRVALHTAPSPNAISVDKPRI